MQKPEVIDSYALARVFVGLKIFQKNMFVELCYYHSALSVIKENHIQNYTWQYLDILHY
jgi:hypothetical protein